MPPTTLERQKVPDTPPVVQPEDDLTRSIQELTKKAGLIAERLRAEPATVDLEAVKAEYEGLKGQLEPLVAEQQKRAREETVKGLLERVDALEQTPMGRKLTFDMPGHDDAHAGAMWRQGHKSARMLEVERKLEPFEEHSFALTLVLAKKGRFEAQKLINEWSQANADWLVARTGRKALAEGTNATGGFLVPPQYIQELVLLRRLTAPLLDYVRNIPVTSNLIYVPTQTGVSSVGWVAENATKPSTDEVLGQIAANLFMVAGIAKVSNQLLEDSTPAVDAIVRQDLMRGLNIEQDRVVINGSGTGQPTGILNTAGITVTAASAQTAASIIDDTLAAIGRVQQNYFGNPDAIVMAPRTWTKLQAAKDTSGRYIALGTVLGFQQMNLPGLPSPTGANDAGTGIGGGPVWNMFGFPVVIDGNVPINLTVAANTNRSVIIVGAFREAWFLVRDEIRTDVSNEAGTSWETNQTWFRSETRVGFTAARLPAAFQTVNDVGP
jgi:HK97 family phage major capsid protein